MARKGRRAGMPAGRVVVVGGNSIRGETSRYGCCRFVCARMVQAKTLVRQRPGDKRHAQWCPHPSVKIGDATYQADCLTYPITPTHPPAHPPHDLRTPTHPFATSPQRPRVCEFHQHRSGATLVHPLSHGSGAQQHTRGPQPRAVNVLGEARAHCQPKRPPSSASTGSAKVEPVPEQGRPNHMVIWGIL